MAPRSSRCRSWRRRPRCGGTSSTSSKIARVTACLAGRFDYVRPDGGFFLWLDVGDGEAVTRQLWAEAAIKVLPGAYLGRADASGRNPGAPAIRVAMVHDLETTEAALERLVERLA
jgi:N-succinyldiaminopimelate aminotransferase